MQWRAVAASIAATFVISCTGAEPAPLRARATLEDELVTTDPWLRPVADPPPRWSRVLEGRTDVLRHRFVRFERPDVWPSPRGRFLVRPFPDTALVLRMRRSGPAGDGYAWSGVLERDPRGWGLIVVRPNGRVAASIQGPRRRFQIVNVESDVYAVLELAPAPMLRCGTEPTEGG